MQGSGVVSTPFVESRSPVVVVRSLHKFGLIVALEYVFLEFGHLIKFWFKDLFHNIVPLEQPLIRGSYFACYAFGIQGRVGFLNDRCSDCVGRPHGFWILKSVFCRGMGDTKNFNIARIEVRLDVILSTESNDVLFGRVVICAFGSPGVWPGFLHTLQQVSYSHWKRVWSSAQQFVHYKDRLLVVGPYVRWYISNQHIPCVWAKISASHIFPYIQNDCHSVFQSFYG